MLWKRGDGYDAWISWDERYRVSTHSYWNGAWIARKNKGWGDPFESSWFATSKDGLTRAKAMRLCSRHREGALEKGFI